mgnify:CR=1 FL=1
MGRPRKQHKHLNGAEHKHCGKCDTWKELKDYGKSKPKWDGLHSMCKVCDRAAGKARHKKLMSTEAGRERERARKRKVQRKSIANGNLNAYYRKRRREDPAFAVKCRLRARLQRALKAQGVQKTTATMTLCGCTLEFLKGYLEKQFVHGMTWENKDLWHIDHIRPCCSFDLTDVEQQKQCFHYTNLQPLFAKDNRIKGGKWIV